MGLPGSGLGMGISEAMKLAQPDLESMIHEKFLGAIFSTYTPRKLTWLAGKKQPRMKIRISY